MTKNAVNVTKGVLTGLAVGSAAGVALTCCMKKPAKRSFKRKAASAIDTVSMFMENLADMAR